MFKKAILFICILCSPGLAQRYDEEINAFKPNIAMLNEAIFRASNEVRYEYGLPLFEKDPLLQKVAVSHAEAMIEQNFYGHNNPYDNRMETLLDRVNYFDNNQMHFQKISENIAQFDLLSKDGKYCLRKQNNGYYYYFDCQTRKRIPLFTYRDFAYAVVGAWMQSEGHRTNLLDPNTTLFGAAVQLSKQPYRYAKPPFARIVQNFGKRFEM